MRPLETQLEAAWPRNRWIDVVVLLAVSGGPDSVALVRAMLALAERVPGRLVLAHFNHGLRGAESDADERFVAELAARWDLPLEIGRRDTIAPPCDSGDGIEAAARAERYRYLLSTAEKRGARYVVTAHTADDQAETVLHRILRGTGVAGLAGMPRARPLSEATTLVRPMLGIRRAEVLAYLEELGQDYRIDSSNQQLDYTRNRLRHDLLPKLEREYNPRVAEAILRLSQLADSTQATIDQTAAELAELAVKQSGLAGGPIGIDCRTLRGRTRHLVRELLVHVWRCNGWPEQAMGLIEWERLADLCLGATSGSECTFPGTIRIWRDDHMLYLQRPD